MGENVQARELALYAMIEIAEKNEYSTRVLGDIQEKYQYMDKKDRAFLYRLCEGTLEQMIRIDEILDRFSSVKVRKMKPVIRNILRLGVYQLLFMDSVPDSAACNESVKLAVKKGFGKLRGFVNGVLRNIARNKENALLPGGILEEEYRKKDLPGFLSFRYSMPRFLVEKWLKEYGSEQTEKMLSSFSDSSPLTARVNLSKCSVEELIDELKMEGVEAKVHPYLPFALELEGVDYLGKLESFRSGKFMIQDISSMMVGQIADITPESLCLDVCAAPGGKSLHIADRLLSAGKTADSINPTKPINTVNATNSADSVSTVNPVSTVDPVSADKCLVIARDLTPEKTARIEENIRRCGFTNIKTEVYDALEFDPEMEEKADLVIADLPCSGLGVMGRKIEIRYQVSEEGMADLALLQRDILDTVWRYVKKGGTLIYSTCTVNPAENEDNFRWFLENHPFHAVPVTDLLPVQLRSETTDRGFVQILPGIHKGDGFFLSKAVRDIDRNQ